MVPDMGELIRRETPKAPKQFDGERFTAAAFGQVEVEHYHRYLLARHYCRGLDVLDIAAGEGYGSALLSQVARSVVGVEIDAEVVRAAAEEFVRPNLRYECGDARRIPLEDGSVDVVVSFETLEHIVEHDEFLAEMKRVLRPNGFIILSTPDSQVYSPMGSAPNPYHVLELTSGEFRALLRRHFANFDIVLQRAFMGSVILADRKPAGVISFENRAQAIIEANDAMAHAPYMIAFASDAALPDISNSLFVHRNDLDTDFRVRIEAELARNAAQEARNGRADAFIYDLPFNTVYFAQNPDSLVFLREPFTKEPLGWAVRKGDPDIINWLNNFLEEIKNDGTYDVLYQRWFEGSAWLKNLN